jgi:hypothetical protein
MYCPKNGAPALQPRKCKTEGCEVLVYPKPKSPSQAFCSRKCRRKKEHDQRAERWRREKADTKPKGVDFTMEDKEALHMAPMRLREAEVALQARRIEAEQEAAREKSYALWFDLLGIRRAA